jgi:hypothetical protein
MHLLLYGCQLGQETLMVCPLLLIIFMIIIKRGRLDSPPSSVYMEKEGISAAAAAADNPYMESRVFRRITRRPVFITYLQQQQRLKAKHDFWNYSGTIQFVSIFL